MVLFQKRITVGVVSGFIMVANDRGTNAFSNFVPQFGTNLMNTKKCRLNLYNDLDSAESFPEGEDLVRSFNEEVRIRQFRDKLEDMNWQDRLINGDDEEEEEVEEEEEDSNEVNFPPFPPAMISADNINDYENPTRFGMGDSRNLFNNDKRKFTGGGGFGGGVYNRNSVKDNMMRQEFGMVSMANSGASLLFQAGVILVTLAFYLYIGLTGGITDGSDRIVEDATTDFSIFENMDLNSVFEKGSSEFQIKSTDGSIWL